jgi:hypothetical protein
MEALNAVRQANTAYRLTRFDCIAFYGWGHRLSLEQGFPAQQPVPPVAFTGLVILHREPRRNSGGASGQGDGRHSGCHLLECQALRKALDFAALGSPPFADRPHSPVAHHALALPPAARQPLNRGAKPS